MNNIINDHLILNHKFKDIKSGRELSGYLSISSSDRLDNVIEDINEEIENVYCSSFSGIDMPFVSGIYTPLDDFEIHSHFHNSLGQIDFYGADTDRKWHLNDAQYVMLGCMDARISGYTKSYVSGNFTPLIDFNIHNHDTRTSGIVSMWFDADVSGTYTPLVDFNIHNHNDSISGTINLWTDKPTILTMSGSISEWLKKEVSGTYTKNVDFDVHNHNNSISGTISSWIDADVSGTYTPLVDFNIHNHNSLYTNDTEVSGIVIKFWQDEISGRIGTSVSATTTRQTILSGLSYVFTHATDSEYNRMVEVKDMYTVSVDNTNQIDQSINFDSPFQYITSNVTFSNGTAFLINTANVSGWITTNGQTEISGSSPWQKLNKIFVSGLNSSTNVYTALSFNDRQTWKSYGTRGCTDTKLLLHLNGTGTDITDSSTFNNPITALAGATQSTTQKKFGTSSLKLTENTDGIRTASGTYDQKWNLGLNDFTIEGWFYPTSMAAGTYPCLCGCFSTGQNWWAWYYDKNNGIIKFDTLTNNVLGISVTFPYTWELETWQHLMITRYGNDFRFFVNGNLTPSGIVRSSTASVVNFASNGLSVGYHGSTNSFSGYIDEFRYINGVAKHVSGFVPETSEYTDIATGWGDVTFSPVTDTNFIGISGMTVPYLNSLPDSTLGQIFTGVSGALDMAFYIKNISGFATTLQGVDITYDLQNSSVERWQLNRKDEDFKILCINDTETEFVNLTSGSRDVKLTVSI
jgi:hypothetical protein